MTPITPRFTRDAFLRQLPLVLVCALFWAANADANTLLYWNGSAPNGPASGTWSMNTNNLTWSKNNDENIANDSSPTSYTNGNSFPIPIFANGNATDGLPGSYTVTVDDSFGQVYITDMHCDVGPATVTGNPIYWISDAYSGPGYNLISVLDGQIFTVNCVLSNAWASADGTAFHKYKSGTLILGATNKWVNESVMIEGGTLMVTAAQGLSSGSSLILGNGDDRTGGGDGQIDTAPTFNTGGNNQTLGTLTLTGPNDTLARTIDFSNGHGTLSFSNSSAISWTTADHINNNANPGPIPLMITNYALGTAKLRFGTDNGGLTPTQLGQIQFQDYHNLPGVIDQNGFVTPSLPVFRSISVVGGTVQLTWTNTVPGYAYELDYRTNLSPTSLWNSLGNYNATSNSLSATVTFAPPSRYYRIQTLIP